MPHRTSTQSIPRAAKGGLTEQKAVPAMGKARRIRTNYWIATGIVSSIMIFSAINFNLKNPLGPMKGAFVHLGYPSYFRIELTVAKVLGVVALLVPAIPLKAKEFAYAGFAITLVSASIAHFSVGDGILFVIDPLFFLGALIVSYLSFRKLLSLRESLVAAHAGIARSLSPEV